MKIERGQHVVVLGSTGSGKTYFVRNCLLPLFDRVLIFDSEDMDFTDFPTLSLWQVKRFSRSNYRFYGKIVLTGKLDLDEPVIEEVCDALLAHGHDMAVYIDEVTDFSDARSIPDPLRALIRKGRKRGISVIVGTQRPAMLSKDYYGNSQHRFIFFLSDYDAAVVREYAPYIQENAARIPYRSWKCLYVAPDSSVTVLSACPRYDWSRRLKEQ